MSEHGLSHGLSLSLSLSETGGGEWSGIENEWRLVRRRDEETLQAEAEAEADVVLWPLGVVGGRFNDASRWQW